MHNTVFFTKVTFFRPIFGPSSDLYAHERNYMSDDEPKLVLFVINCVVHDGSHLDTFINLSTTGMCHIETTGTISSTCTFYLR